MRDSNRKHKYYRQNRIKLVHQCGTSDIQVCQCNPGSIFKFGQNEKLSSMTSTFVLFVALKLSHFSFLVLKYRILVILIKYLAKQFTINYFKNTAKLLYAATLSI